QTFEQTQQMLCRAHENGVSVLVASSHALPGSRDFPLEKYRAHLRQAQEWSDAEGLGIRLCEGAEILYSSGAEQKLLEGKIPTLAGSGAVLVEFYPADSYSHIYNAVRRLGNSGFSVIVAHVERYRALHDLSRVQALRDDLGASIQMNAGTLIHPTGFGMKRWVSRMLEMELCDVAATDAHNVTSRPCRMKECYEALRQDWGEEYADRLCHENPLQLLGTL
ncbi:MAG: hypothetical protein IJS53_04445, partial [Clostridia bacterium]|nr:hypothetical protein [Clostridia bacterium]